MLKLIALNGSPRKNGNTSSLIKHLIKHLPENIESEVLFLSEYSVKPCIDCRGCKKNEMVCIIKDDMQVVYNKLSHSDIIIFGTPIYWFGPTAQSKVILDRLRPYYGNQGLKGKKIALILPAGSGAGDCDLTIEMFKRASVALGINFLGAVTSESFDIGDALKDEKVLNDIEQLSQAFH